ncbi:MAG: cytochrome c [Chitinophagales bacterium]
MRALKAISIIAIIVFAVSSCSKKTSAPTAESKKKIDGSLVYSPNCARCHGSDGTNGKAPNLSQIKLSKAEVADIVTKGHGHMPAFEDKLTKDEIDAVADFVVALKK